MRTGDLVGVDEGDVDLALDGDLLARLVGDVDRFFADAWRRRFVVFPGAGRWLLPQMPSYAEVTALVEGPALDEPSGRRFASFPVDGEVVARMWLGGPVGGPPADEPINLPTADRWIPRLRPLAAALARRFGAPANLQLFLGREGVGLRPHRDVHDSFVLQIAGAKRWTIEDVDLTDGARLRENSGGDFGPGARTITLEPGDVLYKPSHGVHATASLGPGTLSMTASIVTLSAGEALRRWLVAAMELDPVWSIQVPPSPEDRERLAHALAEAPALLPDLESLIAACRPGGEDR